VLDFGNVGALATPDSYALQNRTSVQVFKWLGGHRHHTLLNRSAHFLSNFSENSLTGSYSVVGVDKSNYNGQSIQFFNPRASSSHQYFSISTTQFSPEPLGSFGTANQAFFHGPGLNNCYLSLHKSTPITERLSLSFRAELFNTFNHAQFFGCVSGTFGSARFGDATCARPPRIGQLALKLTF
jgi:hypothetical protein